MLSTKLFSHRYVPARTSVANPTANPNPRERVVVVLHGLGDSSRGYAFLPEALAIPGLSYLLLDAPDAYYGGFSWYDYPGDKGPGVRRSRELLLKLLDELEAQGVLPGDIFLFGFSQGCLMAADVALRAPKALGGIVGVSGYLAFGEEYPQAFSPAAKAQKILITHGNFDPVVPSGPATGQFETLRTLGIDLEIRLYDKAHTMLAEEIADISKWIENNKQ